MLKDWLVRRRENPYPSREEKKSLAIKTGLTYIQVKMEFELLHAIRSYLGQPFICHFQLQILYHFRFAIGLPIGDVN